MSERKRFTFTVLSRKMDSERRHHVSKQLSGYGVEFKFFDAITPETIGDKLEELPSNSKLTLGEKCCALSHISIFEDFLKDTDSDYLIVLEDDVLFFSNPLEALADTTNALLYCDVVILGYAKVRSGLERPIQFFRPLYTLLKFQNVKFCRPYKQWKCGGVCYALSRDSARKMVHFGRTNLHAADDWPAWEHLGLDILHRKPLLAIENCDVFISSLETERCTYRERPIWLRYLAGLARHLYLIRFFLQR